MSVSSFSLVVAFCYPALYSVPCASGTTVHTKIPSSSVDPLPPPESVHTDSAAVISAGSSLTFQHTTFNSFFLINKI